ncbi:MAG: hypothetical protein M0Z99_00200 [Betaproteobacteria bacterium]|nr:hypothetical protein [Betaproteobacteria bacterium]
MANDWALYQRHTAFVLGFHGTEETIVEQVVTRQIAHLDHSQGRYEWLGHGIYFWENDPQRALEWAQDGNVKKKIKKPSLVGAVIDLGLCLDLTTRTGLDEITQAHATLVESYAASGQTPPSNTGGKDRFKRELDCQVIQALHLYRQEKGLAPYDSVRAPFPEDEPLYEGAGFRKRNHIQIAVINPECIRGYFRPIPQS